jgi:hypothetical protein
MVGRLLKHGEVEEKDPPLRKALRALGTSALGTALGFTAGFGGMHLANKMHMAHTGTPIVMNPKIVLPITAGLGLASGYAWNRLKEEEVKELQDAWREYRKRGQGKPPGQ